MEKKFQENHRHIGTAVCERTCTHRSPGRRICTGRYLCALSATEERRCIVYRRFGRTQYLSRFVQRRGVTPQDVVDRYHYLIKKSFEEFGVSFDYTAAPLRRRIMSWLRISLRRYTTKESLSKKHPNNTMTKKRKHSSPTATSPVSVLTAIRKVPTVTNARNAEHPCRPPI